MGIRCWRARRHEGERWFWAYGIARRENSKTPGTAVPACRHLPRIPRFINVSVKFQRNGLVRCTWASHHTSRLFGKHPTASPAHPGRQWRAHERRKPTSGPEPASQPASLPGREAIALSLGDTIGRRQIGCAHDKPPCSRRGSQISISRSSPPWYGAVYRSSHSISRFTSRSLRWSQANIAAYRFPSSSRVPR